MALKLINKRQVIDEIFDYRKRIEAVLIRELEILVAALQNHAKRRAGYEDQTSNLKGSIGGVVIKDGRAVTYKGFDTGGDEGNTTGLEFINSLISDHSKGYTVLVVAGMEYATYVENYHQKNVLKRSELLLDRQILKVLEKLKLKAL